MAPQSVTEVQTLTESPISQEKPTKPETIHNDWYGVITAIRGGVICVAILAYYYQEYLQSCINNIWSYLLSSHVFNSVYFESWFATLSYLVMIPIYPYLIHHIKSLDKYKVDPSVTYVPTTKWTMIMEGVEYLSPLMLMDTFMVKKYAGVNPEIWIEKRATWVQTTRALPLEPPGLFNLVFDLIGSVLIYDLFFFFMHLTLHKNMWLYKYVHAAHHDHDVMHPHVTNKLTVSERVMLILSANLALKVLNSHPLTRMLFVPVFLFLLVDNHIGYDFPVALHTIVPFQIMGGPRKHYQHHLQGARHYQPFLCYLDKILEGNKFKTT